MRAIWTKRSGEKQYVWRCSSRLKNGTKYCHDSPTIQEPELQKAMLGAIEAHFKPQDWKIADHVPERLSKRDWPQLDSVEISDLKKQLIVLLNTAEPDGFDDLLIQAEAEIVRLQNLGNGSEQLTASMDKTTTIAERATAQTEWDETLIRNLVNKAIVQNKDSILVRFRNGKQVVLTSGD